MENTMHLTNAIDFLMWSYFNLTIKDGNNVDRIIHTCIQKAYVDATQQGAYNTMIPKENDELKSFSQNAEIKGGNEIKKAIELLCDNGETKFDSWHKDICNTLVNVYNEKINNDNLTLFSYGNSQKWVNMTLKYVYTLYWIYQSFSDSSEFCNKYKKLVENYSKDFHIPVDSFIIEAFWNYPIDLPLKDGASRNKVYKHPQDYVIPWSKWEKQNYQNLQKTLNQNAESVLECNSQIDWEGSAWIAIAKKRKAKDLDELDKKYNKKINQ